MISITSHIALNESEIKFSFICSPGPGGQNVNKVATAALLRFNVITSTSLPEAVRMRLLALIGKKLTTQGELLIKANRYRTQKRNRQDALERLKQFILQATITPKKRKKSKPSLASRQQRLANKKRHAENKTLRRRVSEGVVS